MPLNIPDNLPATDILANEYVFVMQETQAIHQDIRPLQIAIINLMPVKMTTETHILRLLANSPLQIEVTLLHMRNHVSKNTPREHLETFYKTFDQVKHRNFDGMIITGAPIEHLAFEQVDYWSELTEIMDYARTHVTSTLFICWGSQAGLYYYYGIPKYQLNRKVFGVYHHDVIDRRIPIVRGFDDIYPAPHSRYTEVRRDDILKVPELQLVSESEQAGVYIVAAKDGRQVFVTGHSEYDPLTLKYEYDRDVLKGIPIQIPCNYFPGDDVTRPPVVRWRSHANLLFTNWLNYYVYQATPFDINQIQ